MRSAAWSKWCWPILCGRTRRVALPVSVVVGTVLLAVNQGSQLLAGDADPAMAFRVLANYAIPYVVSSIGYLDASSTPPRSPGAGTTLGEDP